MSAVAVAHRYSPQISWMNSAMRRAHYFPTVVVGLVSFAGHAMIAQRGVAYESIPAAALADAQEISDANYISDSAVQPAGYYDSRPRSKPANKPQGTATQGSTSQAGESQPNVMYRGQKVRVPSLPFGRQTSTSQKNSSSGPQPAWSAGGPAKQTQGRIPQQTPAAKPLTGAAWPNAQGANNRMPQPMRSAQLPSAYVRPSTRPVPGSKSTNAVPNSTSTSPWAKPATTAPAAPPVAPRAASPAVPLSPADRLAADAHELSARAQSEAEFTQVIDRCKTVLSSQPSPATAKFAKNLMAWSLNRRGQLKAEASHDAEAIADFSEAISADPTCWRAIHNRGVLLAQSSQFEKAFDDFAATIRLNPKFAKAYSNRAALYIIADNLNGAVTDYRHSLELDPNLAVAQRGCGRACQLTGQLDEALDHYDAAVRLAPSDSFAAACRADLLTDLGRYADAAAEYNRALELDSKSTQALTGSAWLLATCPDESVRNGDLAIQRAQSAIELGGTNDALNLDTLAAAQANAGDFEAAMNSVRKAIDLTPEDERGPYHDRLLMYERAKPYRIAPIEHTAHQASYDEPAEEESAMK